MGVERVAVFIDGSNLYRNLKSNNCSSMKFNFLKLIKSFVKNRKLVASNYYIGQIKDKKDNHKTHKLYQLQQVLFEKLRAFGIQIITGHIQKIGNVYNEKGVDVKIAVDLVAGCYENKFDTAILVSSDTDLIPAIKKVRGQQKKMEVVGFKNKPIFGLIYQGQKYHELDRKFLESCL